MTRAQAQRLRFGILAARHGLERDRLTPDQVDYLENCQVGPLTILFRTGAIEAYNREKWAVQMRQQEVNSRAALQAHAKRAIELRKKWMA